RAGGPPVYPPRADTLLLRPFAAVRPRSTFLDVGTGSGEIALAAARSGARVVATDLNPHALRLARARAAAERLPIALVRTDLARGLGRFDRVVFNPPYSRPRRRSATRTVGTTWPWTAARTAPARSCAGSRPSPTTSVRAGRGSRWSPPCKRARRSRARPPHGGPVEGPWSRSPSGRSTASGSRSGDGRPP
ncbi:methylase, partial [mine drainage metagenome]